MKCRKISIFVVVLVMILLFSACCFGAEYSLNGGLTVTLNNQIILSNTSGSSITDIKIDMPLMSDTQPDYQQKLLEQFDSRLITTYVDVKGKKRAIYKISTLAAGKSITVNNKYAITNYGIKYKFLDSVVKSTDSADLSKYLVPEKYIESNDAAIIDFANSLVGSETNDYNKVRKIFEGVNLYLTYEKVSDNPLGAKDTLQLKKGTCEDYANLMIACLRSQGIAAGRVTGFRYDFNDLTDDIVTNGKVSINDMRHAWVQFYLEGHGFIVADPTFTYTITSGDTAKKVVNWDFLGGIISESRLLYFNGSSKTDDSVKVTYRGNAPKITFNDYLEYGVKATPYKDIATHWAKNNIISLQLNKPGILTGFPDNTFKPNDNITNAQLAAIISRMLNLKAGTANISDMSKTNWAYDAASAVVEEGIMLLKNDKFYPNNNVTRGEMAMVLVRAFDLSGYSVATTQFSDYGKMPSADKSISILKNLGLAGGYPDNTFKPYNSISRAEVATFLIRIINSLDK